MSKRRVGIIGCGGAGRFFLQGWDAWQDDVEVVALCDVVERQIERQRTGFPELCGEAKSYEDYEKMIAEASLDIVCISSPSDQHLAQGEAALSAGCHVFVEKPTGYNLEEARRFRYLANKYFEQKVAVAYSLRYLKAYIAMHSVLQSGELGEIVTGEISYSHPSFGRGRYRTQEGDAGAATEHPPRAAEQENNENRPRRVRGFEDAGGTYVTSSELTHATHPWDTARYLLGDVRECFSTNRGARGVQMGILWMESGALCHVLAGAVRNTNKNGYNQHQFVQIHGTNGSAWLMRDMYAPYEYHTYYRTDGDIREVFADEYKDIPDSSHGTILRSRNLLNAIEGKAELICDLEDSVRTTDLLHALWLSERTHSKVPVLPANKTG